MLEEEKELVQIMDKINPVDYAIKQQRREISHMTGYRKVGSSVLADK